MYRNNIAVLWISILFCACATPKTISLTHQPSVCKGLGMFHFVALRTQPPDSAQLVLAQALALDTFIITTKVHDHYRYQHDRYHRGEIDAAFYAGFLRKEGFDTTRLFPIATSYTTTFLLGVKGPDLLLIADANNNESLADDSVFVLPNFSKGKTINNLDSLPKVTLLNLQAYVNGRVQTYAKTFWLKPTLGLDNELAGKRERLLELDIIDAGYSLGHFTVKGVPYIVVGRPQRTLNFSYNPQSYGFRFAEGRDVTVFQQTTPKPHSMLQQGDTISLNKRRYRIKQVSPLLDAVTLQPVRNSRKH